MSLCVRCQVLEVPAESDWGARRSAPRDLLPWADPYIAVLMQRLEDRFDVEQSDPAGSLETGSDEEGSWPAGDGAWQQDGFRPSPAEASHGWCPPVYGGWPLLDDLEEGADESAV